ncbi:MAG: alpha/beta fold hydrolase, partial [Acidimicrobiia bacterium]
MRGLQRPPEVASPSRALARILTLLILAVAAGLVIFAATTNQRIDLTEDLSTTALELSNPSEIDGLIINVVEDAGGSVPVVLLHDADVTGGLILSDLSASLPDQYAGVRIDLPGFGYSDRIVSEGPRHTVSGLAEVVAGALEERFASGVLVAGVGLGGEVGAELAVTYPHLVTGLVMVDVDFWAGDSFEVTLQRAPLVGRAATYTWEIGGRFSVDNWMPFCETGGWCASPEQLAERAVIVTIEDTTDSFYGFRQTAEAASAPANLADITTPTAYVWSTKGEVPAETVDRISDEIAGLTVIESDSYQAHLEDPATVASAV